MAEALLTVYVGDSTSQSPELCFEEGLPIVTGAAHHDAKSVTRRVTPAKLCGVGKGFTELDRIVRKVAQSRVCVRGGGDPLSRLGVSILEPGDPELHGRKPTVAGDSRYRFFGVQADLVEGEQ